MPTQERYINPYTDDARDYEESIKVYRDLTNVVNTAEQKGLAKGLAKGRAKGLAEGRAKGRAEGAHQEKMQSARKMKDLGMPIEVISQVTGLTPQEIEAL